MTESITRTQAEAEILDALGILIAGLHPMTADGGPDPLFVTERNKQSEITRLGLWLVNDVTVRAESRLQALEVVATRRSHSPEHGAQLEEALNEYRVIVSALQDLTSMAENGLDTFPLCQGISDIARGRLKAFSRPTPEKEPQPPTVTEKELDERIRAQERSLAWFHAQEEGLQEEIRQDAEERAQRLQEGILQEGGGRAKRLASWLDSSGGRRPKLLDDLCLLAAIESRQAGGRMPKEGRDHA